VCFLVVCLYSEYDFIIHIFPIVPVAVVGLYVPNVQGKGVMTTFWLLGRDDDDKSGKLLDESDTKMISSSDVGTDNMPAVCDP